MITNTGTASVNVGQTAKGKLWRFPSAEDLTEDLLTAVDNNALLGKLLIRRGIASKEAALAFLLAEHYLPTGPMELPDVDKAVVRITQAIATKEHITVYGDYDVDGITGTSLLVTVLRKLGASVDFYIPNRAGEGYGLNLKAVSILASKQRTKLIITCDCGVSNFAEINFAKSLGVDCLVLDHHSMPELMPPAVGIVHPKLLPEAHPLFHLPGVGVAYKVSEALLIDQGREAEVEELLDYVTLGMIADLVPLVRENRYLVQIGLPKLIKSKRPGIQALLGQVRKSEDTDLVGFGLAPRINAVGRLADARVAVDLMTTDDPQVADQIAKQLANDNIKRQEICEQIFLEADAMIQSKVNLEQDKAIAIYKRGWHHGVVGIVASRLVEKYNRPVFIAEEDHTEAIVKGSARSVDRIDLYEVLRANEGLLNKWGGHKMAAGFSVTLDKADTLCRALVDTCNKMLPGELSLPILDVDATLEAKEVDIALVGTFAKLAPFGMSNKKPLFCLKNLKCQNVRILGKDGKHIRLNLIDEAGNLPFEALVWNYQGKAPDPDATIDIVFNPEINNFNGRERLQLIVVDWRFSKEANDEATANLIRLTTVPLALAKGEKEKAAPLKPFRVVEENERSIEPAHLEVTPSLDSRPSLKAVSHQTTWRDLRGHSQSTGLLDKAVAKFRNDLSIFAESSGRPEGFKTDDRTTVSNKAQLILWQYPPALKVLQEMVTRARPQTIYLAGGAPEEVVDVPGFLKMLMALIRFTVGKRDGQVHGEKLAAVLGTTKVAAALGMTLLQKVGAIEWFAEDGLVYIELLGAPTEAIEDFPEYRQLLEALKQIQTFRKWCAEARVEEIQLAVFPNGIRLASQPEDKEPSGEDKPPFSFRISTADAISENI
jgi:single-stranded-DNA-specific exonuclease RecJ